MIALLETYRDATDAEGREQGAYGDPRSDRLLLLSRLWHEGSYAELERALAALREKGPARCYWHVCERYLRSTRRTCWICPLCRRVMERGQTHTHGRSRVGPAWSSVECWHAMVDVSKGGLVEQGTDWLAGEMRHVTLPDEVTEMFNPGSTARKKTAA